MKKISVIVPCYNEQEAIPFFYEAITKEMEKLADRAELELIFVNDGSRDDSLTEMRSLSRQDDRVHYISFSRNFGK